MSSDSLLFKDWLREGLRASLMLAPRVDERQAPRPAHLIGMLALLALLEIGLSRFEVAGAAAFDLRGWLAPWWTTALIVLIAWSALAAAGRFAASAWFTLWTAGMLPAVTVSLGLGIAQARELLPPWLQGGSPAAWGIYLGLWLWTAAVAVRLAAHFGATRRGQTALAGGLVAILAVATWFFPDRPWQPELAPVAAEPAPQLVLSQQTLEAQQEAWRKAVAGLAPERPGVVDVYALVFAPYAEEDVFLRESSMVARLLEDSFDAQGRVLQLVNHATTAETHAWATPLNLQRAVDAIAERMDTQNDLLVVYLTSHGANDFRLAASNPPLAVDPISPGELREALDKAGIRHRVIAVSACYSGGWLGPLGGDTALVMTAADATHTSYGCGRLSELTFFGRAVFDEQLRKTRSFERAFAAAVPVIRQREQEAGKDDGFSNPQISVGEKIKPVLAELEKRLGP
jgi:hypothetical protein